MIKRHQALLLVAIAALLSVSLYGLNPSLNQISPDPNIVQASPFATPESFADADYANHVAQLRKKLPSAEFSIVIAPLFVVIGDESPGAVREHSERTVKWAVDKLKQDFFTKDPKKILAKRNRSSSSPIRA